MDILLLFSPHSETGELLTEYLTQSDYTSLSYASRELRITLIIPAPWSSLWVVFVALGYYQPEEEDLAVH